MCVGMLPIVIARLFGLFSGWQRRKLSQMANSFCLLLWLCATLVLFRCRYATYACALVYGCTPPSPLLCFWRQLVSILSTCSHGNRFICVSVKRGFAVKLLYVQMLEARRMYSINILPGAGVTVSLFLLCQAVLRFDPGLLMNVHK